MAMGTFLFASQRTIRRAGSTFVCFLFCAFVTGAFAFAYPQGADGDHDEGQDNQKHYDGRQVHAMTALAMR